MRGRLCETTFRPLQAYHSVARLLIALGASQVAATGETQPMTGQWNPQRRHAFHRGALLLVEVPCRCTTLNLPPRLMVVPIDPSNSNSATAHPHRSAVRGLPCPRRAVFKLTWQANSS